MKTPRRAPRAWAILRFSPLLLVPIVLSCRRPQPEPPPEPAPMTDAVETADDAAAPADEADPAGEVDAANDADVGPVFGLAAAGGGSAYLYGGFRSGETVTVLSRTGNRTCPGITREAVHEETEMGEWVTTPIDVDAACVGEPLVAVFADGATDYALLPVTAPGDAGEPIAPNVRTMAREMAAEPVGCTSSGVSGGAPRVGEFDATFGRVRLLTFSATAEPQPEAGDEPEIVSADGPLIAVIGGTPHALAGPCSQSPVPFRLAGRTFVLTGMTGCNCGVSVAFIAEIKPDGIDRVLEYDFSN